VRILKETNKIENINHGYLHSRLKSMKENILEIVVGCIVIIIAITFVFFTISSTGIKKKGWYINAEFGNIGGLKVGDDVLIAGIKVGEVLSNKLDSQTFIAIVKLNLEKNISIPNDSIAKISSESLLGGQYVEIIPGASNIMFNEEQTIYNTRDPVSISDLLGQAVFSASN
jgi:phospholipid/cholesterol/gamma-HCH transport system substrate-binding protein